MAHYVIFIEFIKVTWRKNVTSYVKTERLWQKRNFIWNVLQPTRSLCHFRFKSYGTLSDFHKSDFSWPWPLTSTFDLDLDLHLFCKKKRNVVTSRDAKRRLAYKNGNYVPIGISSRINLQPTRSLYDFRFKSYGCYDDFHGFVSCLTLILIFHDNIFFCEFTMFRCMTGVHFEEICLLIAEL